VTGTHVLPAGSYLENLNAVGISVQLKTKTRPNCEVERPVGAIRLHGGFLGGFLCPPIRTQVQFKRNYPQTPRPKPCSGKERAIHMRTWIFSLLRQLCAEQ